VDLGCEVRDCDKHFNNLTHAEFSTVFCVFTDNLLRIAACEDTGSGDKDVGCEVRDCDKHFNNLSHAELVLTPHRTSSPHDVNFASGVQIR
jgi:hypothetical protein